jgi:hypothetical protein
MPDAGLGATLSPHADDAGVHQLLDLGADARVAQVLLQGGWVVLGLLEDALHDGVLQDACDL